MKQPNKSKQIAVGGVFSALCLMIMFLTGFIPFGTYAFPALAGAMLVAVVESNGMKVAFMVYASVSLLSFVVPDHEAAMMFVAFFGYYPMLKQKIEKLPWKIPQWILKLVLFNGTIVIAYFIMMTVLGMPDILDDLGDLGRYAAFILLGLGSLVFLLYDYCLTKYTEIFRSKFKNILFKQ